LRGEEPKERARSVRTDELEAIFAELRDDCHDVTNFAILTGIRFNGCVSLVWRNIDFEKRTITYVKKRQGGRQSAEWETLPMAPDVEAILRRQIGRHRMQVWTYVAQGKKGGNGGSQLGGVYVKGERYPMTYQFLQTRWKRALKKSGVTDFRFHDLRHTAATRLLAATGNLKLVQKMLSHANIATTTKYTHITEDGLREAMEATHRAYREAQPVPENVAAIRKGDGK
jgi:integrase